jgi:mRNA-degrading endonuclease RelE of RelBE toxin-antitoxin system
VSDAPWGVALSRTAQRDMRWTLPSADASSARCESSQPTHIGSGALRKLTAAPESRLRIGDWRALIALDEKTRTINVVRVLPRDRAYDR